ncbi:dephospho-CoA kinase [Capnocytophaga cynodegmi]|uniref:Dephospho-CoA kinase n=1 Tax=Capnocytophaga cynodegmi TaxID=28189 RepID=A0A0B7H1R3_9FLAO|nr:dephospho-CoA kinase [Capnocytophaga cynodegmi]GIM55600.1 dephospho-CoA kinase [Capnocytophaga cynodegmi]GJQ07900.1 dephospho-CoA kinase [Capnocytophaga cynodegmi]CEN33516.1 Dephospho-CoA kinase [Capnocytophaga cynodegmi]
MMVVGLTGGIGSGKTTIAKMFEKLGISVYISDQEAQKLIESDENIKNRIKSSFGELAYINGKYNRKYIAEIVFKDKDKLSIINEIVHPEVAKHFSEWKTKQNSPYVIKESAILFESGAYQSCDYIITVIAPEQERIRRVVERDGVSEKSVRERIKNQWTDEKRISLSNEVINNINIEISSLKVQEIHSKLIKKLRKQ